MAIVRAVVVAVAVAVAAAVPSHPLEDQALVSQDEPVGFFREWSAKIPGSTGSFGGVAVVDIDGDSRFEVFLNGQRTPNKLLKFNSEDGWVDTAPAVGLTGDPTEAGMGAVGCDVDGDGREELYVVRASANTFKDRLYKQAASTKLFEDHLHLSSDLHTAAAACSDAAGSGVYDILLGEFRGGLKLHDPRHHNTSFLVDPLPFTDGDSAVASTFSALAAAPLLHHNPPVPPSALDIFAGNAGGANHFLAMIGVQGGVSVGSRAATGPYRPAAAFADKRFPRNINDARGHARSVAILDVNNDGHLDVVVANSEAPGTEANPVAPVSGHHLFLNTGKDLFSDTTFDALRSSWAPVRGVVAADFDNDGHEELLLINAARPEVDAPNTLLHKVPTGTGDGAMVWQAANAGDARDPLGVATSAAVVDVDGDGYLDVILTRTSDGQAGVSVYNYVHPSNQPSHSYLRIAPLTRYGSPARGASVVLTESSGRIQTRVIDSGGSSAAQHEPVAHFGLGATRVAYSVQVTWADGRSVTLLNPEPNQVLRVPYPFAEFHAPVAEAAALDEAEARDTADTDECMADTCIAYEVPQCPAADDTYACKPDFFFDRAADQTCYCRRGYELTPCPTYGSSSDSCALGFTFHRMPTSHGDRCYCRKSDGSDAAPARTEISAADLLRFQECLRSNLMGPLRCVAMMEALGYSAAAFSNLPNRNVPRDTAERYHLDPCPPAGEDSAACRPGYRVARQGTGDDALCFCELDQAAPQFQVDPCPNASDVKGLANACPTDYHLARRAGDNGLDVCYCVKDMLEIKPCPSTVEAGEHMCDAGFRFLRLRIGGKEQCFCSRSGWEISPCPNGDGKGLCPPHLKFQRVSLAQGGQRCSCVDPSLEDTTPECHHCAYGNGQCAYSSFKGWYCRCDEQNYMGADCIPDWAMHV